MATSLKNDLVPDVDEFRLRRFVDRMIDEGEVEVVDEPVALADVAARMDGNEKAVLFRQAGPEKAELIGSMTGGRRRSICSTKWMAGLIFPRRWTMS